MIRVLVLIVLLSSTVCAEEIVHPVVVVYTGSPCEWCDKWEREERPKLQGYRFLTIRKHSKQLVPSFLVMHRGFAQELRGFQTAEVIKRTVAGFRRNSGNKGD